MTSRSDLDIIMGLLMERITFEPGKFYHVYNRGVEKHVIFRDEKSYWRFVCSMYYFNDSNFNPENFRYQGQTLIKNPRTREELVDIIAWCLMPSHYHLLLRERNKGGITKFMRRLGTGYTMYVNKKYERSGHIFEGAFKTRYIDRDDYLLHATRYIHLNPLELYDPSWKGVGVKNVEDGKNFILQYRWSSLHNYLGKPYLAELLSLQEFWRIFEIDRGEYKDFLWEWLKVGIPAPFDTIKV